MNTNLTEIISDYKKLKSMPISVQKDYWLTINRCMKDNPDLPYSFIKNALLAKKQISDDKTLPFTFIQ